MKDFLVKNVDIKQAKKKVDAHSYSREETERWSMVPILEEKRIAIELRSMMPKISSVQKQLHTYSLPPIGDEP